MNWEQLRATCLALPGAIETFSFGPGCSVFKAPNGRMFAVSVTTAEPLDVSVKCDPDVAADLRRTFAAIRRATTWTSGTGSPSWRTPTCRTTCSAT